MTVVEKLRTAEFRKEYAYLMILTVVGILWRAFPHMFLAPHMFPADEQNVLGRMMWLVEHGRAHDPFTIPYLEFYLVYAVQLILKIDVIRLSFLANPVIGGMSVLAFYFFVSGMLSKKESLWATLLFTFSETHFYRTCHFSSTEALGLFFMLMFFGFYVRKRKGSALLLLSIILFAHTLPFIFSVFVVAFHILLGNDNRRVGLMAIVLMGLAVMVPLVIHTAQTTWVLSGIVSSFSVSNIFVYGVSELLEFLPIYFGVVIMSVVGLLRSTRWNEMIRALYVVSVVAAVVSLLGYNSGVIAPTRLLVYITIPSICVVVTENKDRRFLIVLVVIMIASPLVGGLNKVLWVADSITVEEMEAVDWILEEGYFKREDDVGFNHTRYGTWFFDTTMYHYTCLYGKKAWMNYEVFLNYKDQNASWEWCPGQAYQPDYVLLSERMETRGFFLDRGDSGSRFTRSKVNHVPIEDIWRDDPNWREIYNHKHVIIYENKIFAKVRSDMTEDE